MTTGDHGVRGPFFAGTLHAFDALDLTNELWNSDMNGDRDKLGLFTSYVSPTVANGRVYVPTVSNELVIYGLMGEPAPMEDPPLPENPPVEDPPKPEPPVEEPPPVE
jgi:hypothetical protein